MYRLGTRRQDRVRPLKVELKSEDQLKEVQRAARKLGKVEDPKYSKISIARDMTPLELEEMRSLVRQVRKADAVGRKQRNSQMGDKERESHKHPQKGPKQRSRGEQCEQSRPVNRQDSLKCIYTNVDTLLNKRSELLNVFEVEQPDVVCFCEILPKNPKLPVS